jgi:hypothetical protein
MADLTTLATVKRWLGLADKAITGITKANPGVVTCAGHDLVTGDRIIISGVAGMTQVNGVTFTVTVIDANSFSLGVNTGTYGAYTSGGYFNGDDVNLARLITAASAGIESYLGRAILEASYTYVFSASNRDAVLLPNYPVTEITSVTIDDVAIPAATSHTTPGYMFTDYGVVLIGYLFTRGILNCTVVYKAGYETVPYDVEQACVDLVALRYAERDRAGVQSKSLAGESISYSQRDMPESVKSALEGYKKVVPL